MNAVQHLSAPLRPASSTTLPARRRSMAVYASAFERPWRLSQVGEDVIEPRAVVPAGQPVPGGEQVRIRLPEGLLLVGENLQSQAGVQLGVIEPAPSLSDPSW